MRSRLCVRTLDAAHGTYPGLRGAIVQSDRAAVDKYGIFQSMNSEGGRCHDNARYESMCARMKNELFYDRLDPERLTLQELKALVWRYFMSYWNNRSAPSTVASRPLSRERYYSSLMGTAA